MTYQVVSFCRREKNKGKKGKLKKREKKERGCLHVWKRVSSPLCASTRGRVPSSQYLCQVGLDSRPLPRPHWASVQSRDPISLLMIGCGLLPTLRQKETSSSFREKIQKKTGGVSFPRKSRSFEAIVEVDSMRLIETKMFQRTVGDSCQRVLLNSGKCGICLILKMSIHNRK